MPASNIFYSRQDDEGDMPTNTTDTQLISVIGNALTHLLVLAIAMFGGLVRFIRRLNHAKEPLPLRILACKLIGELVTSGFAGLLTYWLCAASGVSGLMTAVLVGISGHLGGNAIDGMTSLYRAWIALKQDR